MVLEDGERIDADVVISDADPVETFGRLVEPGALSERFRRKVRSTEHTPGTFSLYLGMRRDLRRYGLGAWNVWDFPDWDLDAIHSRAADAPLQHAPAFFLSPNSLKDDTGALAPPECSTLEIVTFMPYARFERFRGSPVGQRGAEYEGEKRRVSDWLLEAVERRWPGLVGDVVVQEASDSADQRVLRASGQGLGARSRADSAAVEPPRVPHHHAHREPVPRRGGRLRRRRDAVPPVRPRCRARRDPARGTRATLAAAPDLPRAPGAGRTYARPRSPLIP